MNRQYFGQWGVNLKPREFAGALAALLWELYEETPTDILAKLVGVDDFDRKIPKNEGEHQPPIRLCFDSTYHFADDYRRDYYDDEYYYYYRRNRFLRRYLMERSAEYFYQRWRDFTDQLRDEHERREEDRYLESHYRLEPRPFHLRLELYTNSKNALWLSEQLSQSSGDEISVYLRSDDPTTAVKWNWSLKVGFLPDKNSRLFRNELEEYIRSKRVWLSPLIELINLDSENDSCDLLIIPDGLRAALGSLLAASVNIKISADCVLIIGQTGEKPEDVPSLIETFRRTVSTAGVGVVNVSPEKRMPWFADLIRELSHNEPVDVAFFEACRKSETPLPFLVASRRLTEFSKLAESVKSLGEKLSNIKADKKIEISGEDAWNFGVKEGSYQLNELGDLFLRRARDFRVDREGSSATSVTRVKNQISEILAADETPNENQIRWIQAQIYDLSRETEPRVLLGRALRANAPHEAVVRIGTEDADWKKSPEQFAPDLPIDKESHRLTVILTEPQLFQEPQVSSIVLPPRGNSSECRFYFFAGEGIEKIEARISIVYKNRVLQTALLKAPVVGEPSESSEKNQIELVKETVVRADFSGLDERRHFDAAFILNSDVNDAHRVTVIKDDHAAFVEPQRLLEFVEQVDEFITEIADEPQDYDGKLDNPATVNLLSKIAKQGWMLRNTLAKDSPIGGFELADAILPEDADDAPTADTPQRIQIISAKADTRLPFEFLYDRAAPAGQNIALCPKAVEALEQRGKCYADCPGIKNPESHVCPLGFWGLSKIIERHTHSKYFISEMGRGDFLFQSEPANERKSLNVFKKVLFAASDQADVLQTESPAGGGTVLKKGGVKEIISTLNGITKTKTKKIVSWKKWCERIESDAPSALVLLTHTQTTAAAILALEIGDGSDEDTMLLEMSSIKREHVCYPEKHYPPPIVLLIGCETGSTKLGFMNFIASFRQSGAAIIVSTGATILGRHAVPVTNELLKQLHEFSQKPNVSFGEVMRVVKQKMLARGIPMVLTLMSYGDADWQIGTAEIKK